MAGAHEAAKNLFSNLPEEVNVFINGKLEKLFHIDGSDMFANDDYTIDYSNVNGDQVKDPAKVRSHEQIHQEVKKLLGETE